LIIQSIVEKMGGRISLDGDSGKGEAAAGEASGKIRRPHA